MKNKNFAGEKGNVEKYLRHQYLQKLKTSLLSKRKGLAGDLDSQVVAKTAPKLQRTLNLKFPNQRVAFLNQEKPLVTFNDNQYSQVKISKQLGNNHLYSLVKHFNEDLH